MIAHGSFQIGDMVEITWNPPPQGYPPTSIGIVTDHPFWQDDFWGEDVHKNWRYVPVLVNGNRVEVRDRWCTVVE